MAYPNPPILPKPLSTPISSEDLTKINNYLTPLTPQQILAWAVDYLPSLYQTTAFGLTGIVAIDILSHLPSSTKRPPLIFIDTMYHFPETYDLVENVKKRYNVPVTVYKPDGCSNVTVFEEKHGERYWEIDEAAYDFAVKIEPGQRAYSELHVQSVITGRRASQGAARAALPPLEVDATGLFKLNPLFAWDFAQVKAYADENDVPHNALLDQGYKSVGDWHSTVKTGEGEDERSGRWKGQEKTECGLHEDFFKKRAEAKKLKAQKAAADSEATVTAGE